ncbi:MAG: YdbH domain-containing protein [Woeseiaceae bacterium]
MRVIKYLAIALIIAVFLGTIAWFLRDSIIQRLSGPILQEYNLAIIDVSLDALATEAATISYLEIEHENGTTIAVDDLTLPIVQSKTAIKTFSAEKVTVTVPATNDDKPLDLANLLERILLLPSGLPNTEVRVTELAVAPYPAIRELRWATGETGQSLAGSLGTIALSAEIIESDRADYQASIVVNNGPDRIADQAITVDIQKTVSATRFSGTTTLDMPASIAIATSLAESLGITQPVVGVGAGTTDLVVNAELANDPNQKASINIQVMLSAPFDFDIAATPDETATVSVRSASPLRLEATYPELQWSIHEEHALLTLSYKQWNDVSVSLASMRCEAGAPCSAQVDVVVDDADLTFAQADRLEASGEQDISFYNNKLQLVLHPDTELSLTAVSSPDIALARLSSRLISGAMVNATDAGWQLVAESVDGTIESLSAGDGIAFSAPVSLRDLTVGEADQVLSASASIDASTSHAAWQDLRIALPGFRGAVSQDTGIATLTLTTAGLHEEQEAGIRAQHNLDAGTGQLAISDAALSFGPQPLSQRVSPWSLGWDIRAGEITGEVQLNWQTTDAGLQLEGTSSIQLSNLAGNYDDTVFAGLTTTLKAAYETASGFSVEPSTITIGLIEVGLPVEDISADYALDLNERSVDVDNLRMTAFGGAIKADPFSYQLGRERNSVLLRAESINLSELLTIEEFEAIEVSGSISAELPLTIEGNAVTIGDGRLTGIAPGGVIRYLPDIVPEDTGTSSLGFVTRALSNFEYETLSSAVDYDEDGDLKLQMQIFGRNPDMEEKRPILLNLGVENNIPQLLRSLQAARAVEDILERRIAE